MSIDNPNEVPEQWWPYFRKQGMDGLTFRELARRVDGVALTTIVRALTGVGQPTRRVIDKIAPALGMTAERFNQVRADVIGAQHHEPFQLPQRADELDTRERDLITGLVHALLDARDRHAAQPTTPADPPAEAPRTPGTQNQKTRAGDKPAPLNPENQAGSVKPLRRRGRDFDANPIIDVGYAAHDRGPDDESEADRARQRQDEYGEESQDPGAE